MAPKNNFSRDARFIEDLQKKQYHEEVQQTLNKQIRELVEDYEKVIEDGRPGQTGRDKEEVEDMILELYRMAQKTHGAVPHDQYEKL